MWILLRGIWLWSQGFEVRVPSGWAGERWHRTPITPFFEDSCILLVLKHSFPAQSWPVVAQFLQLMGNRERKSETQACPSRPRRPSLPVFTRTPSISV